MWSYCEKGAISRKLDSRSGCVSGTESTCQCRKIKRLVLDSLDREDHLEEGMEIHSKIKKYIFYWIACITKNHSAVCLPLSSLHSVRWSLGPSMLQQVALVNSFSWLSNIPLYTRTTCPVSNPLLMDTQVASVSWLFRIVLEWTLKCVHLFELQFCLDIMPRNGTAGSYGSCVFSF